MRAKYVLQETQELEILIEEFLLINESTLNEGATIQKIKNAVSKGIKISLIVTALISAGYSPAQAHTNIEKAGVEITTNDFNTIIKKASNLKTIIRLLKIKGFKVALGQNPRQLEYLEKQDNIQQHKFVGKTKSAISIQKMEYFRQNNIKQNNTVDLVKVANNQLITIVLYSK